MIRRRSVLFACLLALSGCQTENRSSPAEASRQPPIRIGLIPEQSIFRQIDRYRPLAEYLSEKTGRKFELTILPRYGNIVENFRSLGLDGAFFGSFTYTLAHERLGVEVIARPVAPDNTSTYYGVLLVRKDSGIRTPAQMKGKRFVFVDKATTAGYLLPLEYFRANGIPDYRTFFRETYFAGTHEGAIQDVLDRKADVGAAKSTVFLRMSRRDGRVAGDLVVLATSPDVPENGLAFRKDFDPAAKERIREILLGMAEDPAAAQALGKLGAERFIPTSNEDYRPVYQYARRVGIDLALYDYVNR
ncbi:MAG TPA: phosphate/phosphite/phosphonate ABC transporter substrate-binding protein [Candidatus Deferrimicrobiaceae bacterium]